jgi:hypothetical protein
MDKRVAFDLGYTDERAGKRFLDNPYLQDSDEFRVWIDGYVKSMRDRSAPEAG